MANWLQLRRGLPGTDGPFLLEHQGAYEALDLTTPFPRMVVAIGASEKRTFLQNASNTPNGFEDGISLLRLGRSTIIADCDLHNINELLPIDPRAPLHGDGCHNLRNPPPAMQPSQIREFAQGIYWQALAPSLALHYYLREISAGSIQSSTSSAHGSESRSRIHPRRRLEY